MALIKWVEEEAVLIKVKLVLGSEQLPCRRRCDIGNKRAALIIVAEIVIGCPRCP